jgi:hypothetical protein
MMEPTPTENMNQEMAELFDEDRFYQSDYGSQINRMYNTDITYIESDSFSGTLEEEDNVEVRQVYSICRPETQMSEKQFIPRRDSQQSSYASNASHVSRKQSIMSEDLKKPGVLEKIPNLIAQQVTEPSQNMEDSADCTPNNDNADLSALMKDSVAKDDIEVVL